MRGGGGEGRGGYDASVFLLHLRFARYLPSSVKSKAKLSTHNGKDSCAYTRRICKRLKQKTNRLEGLEGGMGCGERG